eukprot:TRINITY_DN3747_c0_g1_i1.p1 TRINITY_DN3747_c0_g1~~TRINITY_DN3747_c0_g1_i1.p1  ORF type:complete len:277 (-),score=56.76 TRINITY_DN3747_c0_g1_i1:52-858(-)
MEESLGFLGCGSMGGALLEGWLKTEFIPKGLATYVCTKSSGTALALKWGEQGVQNVDALKLFQTCHFIVLAVKPDQIREVMKEVRDVVTANHLIISIAAGWKYDDLRNVCAPARVVKTMPNVACRLGQGTTLILDRQDRAGDVEFAGKMFSYLGTAERLPTEASFHPATALAGCGPAYIFLAMEAMADGAVAQGLSRATAYRLAAAACAGAGALALVPDAHPGKLKDSVTSPGGITIQAVRELEKHGFRSALLEAVIAATERSIHMSS